MVFDCCSVTQSCLTLWDPMDCSTFARCPSPSTRVCPSSCLLHQWCCSAMSSSDDLLLPSNFPSIRDFSNELSVHIRWPKYWSFSFIISPSSENPGLISLKIDWFDLLAVQGTFRNLLQYHNLKASILFTVKFFTVTMKNDYLKMLYVCIFCT